MNNYEPFRDDFEDDNFILPHLPLDWNEDLTLEEYLERMEDNAKRIDDSHKP